MKHGFYEIQHLLVLYKVKQHPESCVKNLLFLLLLPALAFGQNIKTIQFSDGIYVGELRDNKLNGQGTFTFANGDIYVGEFRDDKRHGQGTYTFANGHIYVGEFRDGKFNGQGTLTYADGSTYVGEHRDGKFNGQGTYTYADGSTYVGEHRDDMRHGQGTYTYADGSTYVGEFRDGKFNGQGTFTFPSGGTYVGEFRDSKLHGQGTYTFPDGSTYVGEFRNDKLNGQGTLTYATGEILNGIWEDGTFKSANNIVVTSPQTEIPNNIAETSPPNNPDNTELLQAASGSGFAVSYEGYIVTNNHVIEGCENVKVHNLGTVIDATVISRDPLNDLAILKADFRPSAIFALGDKNPVLLQDIYVAGFPFGENISSSVKVTKGIISSLTGLGNNFSNIQIDAAIQPGNSGGPIFDNNGNVIGVAVATLDIEYALDRFDTIPQNTNFGIKANIVSNLLSSNGVETSRPSAGPIQTTQLGQLATNATYYLSCWMTMAQIEQMSSTKVLFNELRK